MPIKDFEQRDITFLLIWSSSGTYKSVTEEISNDKLLDYKKFFSSSLHSSPVLGFVSTFWNKFKIPKPIEHSY